MQEKSPLEAARDALYAAPLAEFVASRARLAAELRTKGEKELAKTVLALRKPSVVAWAMHQLLTRQPEQERALHALRARAEGAQREGGADKLRAAISDYWTRVDELVAWVEASLKEAGHAATREQLRSVREMLATASDDPEDSGGESDRASLVQTIATLDTKVSDPPSVPRGRPIAPTAHPEEPPHATENAVDLAAMRLREQAERRVEEATTALHEAEAHEAKTRAELHDAEQNLLAATRAVEKARAKVDAAQSSRTTLAGDRAAGSPRRRH